MWMYYLRRLFLVVLLASYGCNGESQYDLFDLTGLSPDDITVAGTASVKSPLPAKNGISFDKNTADIKLNTRSYAYVADLIQNSDDLTFAVFFRIMKTKDKTVTYFPMFGLSDSKLLHNYFSIGLKSEELSTPLEGKIIYNGTIIWTLFVDQWVKKSKSSSRTFFPLGKKLELGKWTILMVRIRKANVEVSLDCKLVVKQNLNNGPVERFSYDGWLTFSQFFSHRGSRKTQFVGSLCEPQLISGPEAYDWYNPCTRDTTQSKINPEPLASDYDDSKFQKFIEIGKQESRKIVIDCIDKNGVKRRNNGDMWIENKCYRYHCLNGKIIEEYMCGQCEDDDGTEYKIGVRWADKNNKCLMKTCDQWREIEKEFITCKPLKCDKEDSYQPKNECCPKCKDDDCARTKRWIDGCERKCTDGGWFACPEKKKGCWCPENEALDLDEETCIPTRECKCSVSGNIYLPGQSIRKSLCSICLCSHGKLVCFVTC